MNRCHRGWSGLLYKTMIAGLLITASVANAQEPPTDSTIAFWVVEALREDPRVRFSNIKVASEHGVVRLTGSVFSLAESQYARLIALKIQGVRKVSNQLMVESLDRSDADIVADVRRRILQSSSVRLRGLKITGDAGQVVVAGTVNSLPQREEATLLASEVRGVRGVRNEMEISFPNHRPDAEVAKDIEAAMKRDVYLNTLPINIAVDDGVATLEGTVGNAYQRERATQEARRVENVIAVDNRLEVDWLRERGVRDEMPRPSDEELKIAVRAELAQDLRIDAADISVAAIEGHVSLRGSVGSFYEKQLATQSAMSVAGALWVSNLLAVRVDWREDREITSDVVFGLQSDYLLRNQRISVRVADGAVTLSGTVNSANEKVHAADVAGRVRGVRSVSNALEVAWTPKFRDAAIADRVKTRLLANWETRWVAGKIKVKVESGKVTLNGVVNTWGQWREAGRIAYLTDGVWSVDNQLAIDNVDYRWEEWFSDSPPIYNDAYPEYRNYFFERRF